MYQGTHGLKGNLLILWAVILHRHYLLEHQDGL